MNNNTMDNKKEQGSCGFGKKKCKNGYTPSNRELYKKIKITIF